MPEETSVAKPPETALEDALAGLGRQLAEREADHGPGLARARRAAEELHERVRGAIGRFNAAVEAGGASHLALEVSEVRPDAKHVRAVEFELARGRYRAIVTIKSRGEVTLVGPFRQGKAEGPCRTFPIGARAELDAALESFLTRLAEEAATP